MTTHDEPAAAVAAASTAAGASTASSAASTASSAVVDPPAAKAARRGRRPGGRTLAWAAAWTAAAVLLGVSGWVYADTRGDGALGYGKARDAALDAGRADIARVTSVERGHVDRDLAAWLDVTSGPLHDQLTRSHTSDAGRLKAADTTASGDVTDAAVTELDTRAGTARLIATVSVRTTPASGAATSDRKRFEAALSRTGGTWKLTALTAVPLGAS
jgi:Mce-associated membrane protein